MRLESISAVERHLKVYVDEAGRLSGKNITLERTEQLADHVGRPQSRLKVIHVAGTSGKTSTSYYTAALLQASGAKVGLTVSPHMDSIVERAQINGSGLPDNVFCDYMGQFLDLVESSLVMPTYFELMMVFALWVFDKEAVDYAVIETGLGGLHDSSNICQRQDKVAVITDIGYDHMHVLGHTLSEIAGQKFGIVHRHNTVVMYDQDTEIMTVAKNVIESKRANLMLVKPGYLVDELPLFQRRNWQLAKTVFDVAASRDGLNNLTNIQLEQTKNTIIPGRMDIQEVGDQIFVLDGAHNEQKLRTFLASFAAKFPDTKPLVMLALKQGKDTASIAPLIAQVARQVVVTGLEISQDIVHQAESSAKISGELRRHDFIDIVVIDENQAALEYCLAQDDKLVLVIGSLYLVSNVRKLIIKPISKLQ